MDGAGATDEFPDADMEIEIVLSMVEFRRSLSRLCLRRRDPVF
jgi:hypothetical protein